MFHQDFYPTPYTLACQMLEGVSLSGKCVLDPSAGKGDLLKACRYKGKPAKMFAIEIVPELQAILRADKDIQIIGEDFLQYSGNVWADLIIMNPPFSAAGKHLRRAWDMLRSGELISVIPASMIWTPTAEEACLLEELRESGAIFENVGSPFITAERKTAVEVFIIRAKKEAESLMDFSGLKTGTQSLGGIEEATTQEMINADGLERLTSTYQAAVHSFADVLRQVNKLKSILAMLPGNKVWDVTIGDIISKGGTGSFALNDLAFKLQGYVWEALFDRTNISAFVSSRVREEFHATRQKAGGIDLTPENIAQVFSMVMGNTSAMMQDSLEQAFDIMTKYHEANRTVIKNYKTNDAWMVKNKIILPYMVEAGWSGGLSFNYRKAESCDDIDKALCLLSGIKYEDINKSHEASDKEFYGGYKRGTTATLRDAVERACKGYSAGENTSESHFFKVKVFAAGTVHLWWKDQDLLDLFNAKVCQGRGWLPGDYGKSYRRKDKPTEAYEI